MLPPSSPLLFMKTKNIKCHICKRNLESDEIIVYTVSRSVHLINDKFKYDEVSLSGTKRFCDECWMAIAGELYL